MASETTPSDNLLKATFPTGSVKPEEAKPDAQAEYLKKAKESISGSMVFVERSQLYWDGKEEK